MPRHTIDPRWISNAVLWWALRLIQLKHIDAQLCFCTALSAAGGQPHPGWQAPGTWPPIRRGHAAYPYGKTLVHCSFWYPVA